MKSPDYWSPLWDCPLTAFDILKPFPIRLLERKISGGSGIVLDDVLAGVYANLTLRFVIAISGILSSR